MSELFFTADTHFADPRILKIDRRPFENLAEHDGALIEQWNAVVGPRDVVWHLGDFAYARHPAKEELLAGLNGRKHLVIGNNDDAATRGLSGWEEVLHYREMTIDGKLAILCHYPFRTWNQKGKGSVNLHGHSHGRLRPETRQYDVGVDVFRFAPVPLETVLASRKGRRGGQTATPRD